MKELLGLVSTSNTYMNTYYSAKHYNHILVRDIALYITQILRVFGVIESNDTIGYQAASQSDSLNVKFFKFCFYISLYL